MDSHSDRELTLTFVSSHPVLACAVAQSRSSTSYEYWKTLGGIQVSTKEKQSQANSTFWDHFAEPARSTQEATHLPEATTSVKSIVQVGSLGCKKKACAKWIMGMFCISTETNIELNTALKVLTLRNSKVIFVGVRNDADAGTRAVTVRCSHVVLVGTLSSVSIAVAPTNACHWLPVGGPRFCTAYEMRYATPETSGSSCNMLGCVGVEQV
jgi:hypothetical protein